MIETQINDLGFQRLFEICNFSRQSEGQSSLKMIHTRIIERFKLNLQIFYKGILSLMILIKILKACMIQDAMIDLNFLNKVNNSKLLIRLTQLWLSLVQLSLSLFVHVFVHLPLHFAEFNCSVAIDIVDVESPFELLFRCSSRGDVHRQHVLPEVDGPALVDVESLEEKTAQTVRFTIWKELPV